MPVDRELIEERDDARPAPTAPRDLLERHPDRFFTGEEIAERVRTPRWYTRLVLWAARSGDGPVETVVTAGTRYYGWSA